MITRLRVVPEDGGENIDVRRGGGVEKETSVKRWCAETRAVV